jgi:hypothetical protein
MEEVPVNNNRGYMGLGILLLIAGAVLLLQNLGVLGETIMNLVWVLLFGLGGLAFLLVFFFNREHWWALIPGCTLLGLAVLIGFGEQLQAAAGALFMAAIGLSFALIYILRREHWWPIIPAGSLFSVAALILAAGAGAEAASVGVLFLGLALTFLLVYLLPGEHPERRWALIPAGVLAVLGVVSFISLSSLAVMNYIWPAALIVGGGYLLWRTWRMRQG